MKRLISAIAGLLVLLALLVHLWGVRRPADDRARRRTRLRAVPEALRGRQHGLRQRRPDAVAVDHRRARPDVDLRRVRRARRGRRRDRPPALPARGERVPPERRGRRLRLPGQGRAGPAGLHGRDRARRRHLRRADRATAADAAGHDDLPLRPWRLEDRPPARRHDGRSGASYGLRTRRRGGRRGRPAGVVERRPAGVERPPGPPPRCHSRPPPAPRRAAGAQASSAPADRPSRRVRAAPAGARGARQDPGLRDRRRPAVDHAGHHEGRRDGGRAHQGGDERCQDSVLAEQ